jgi:5-methylcytosine-specific restriction endonuclease McrA
LPLALKRLRDGLNRLDPQVSFLERDTSVKDRERKAVNPLRQLYGTAKWQRLRWSILVRDLFTCRMCKRCEGGDTSQLVADHIQPHRGDVALFWLESNLQCLCKGCHDRVKQKEEAATRWGRG